LFAAHHFLSFVLLSHLPLYIVIVKDAQGQTHNASQVDHHFDFAFLPTRSAR
jgi:hypothetical protein